MPDLNDPQRLALWVETERAKKRLLFTLLELGLPLSLADKQPLRFRLLADRRVDTGEVAPPKEEPIYIGHDSGCLTLNVVEADDAVREAMRKRMNERYRTMLGHLRHEIGHYYWYLLVDGTGSRRRSASYSATSEPTTRPRSRSTTRRDRRMAGRSRS